MINGKNNMALCTAVSIWLPS